MKGNEKVVERLLKGEGFVAVVGLGYVGMPLAVEFAKQIPVVGFDLNKNKIQKYINGIDVTDEVGNEALKESKIDFTWDEDKLSGASVFVVAVPTPVNSDKKPDLYPVISATEIVAKHITKGSIIVYESTVYPGTTEDICIPILEEKSGLKCGKDFEVGYSPERINPSDKVHTLKTIKKIVSATSPESTEILAQLYSLVVEVGVHKAESIKVAEAAKVLENSQRDINIAFMNEVSMILDIMDINTKQVVSAMNTKWNALGFTPGLVGGHCIGVDPYYFVYKAEQLGYHSQIISAGRKVNDDMPMFAAERIVKKMILAGKRIKGSKVGVLGVTFKENCPDTRNSKIVDMINELNEYGIDIYACDPVCDSEDFEDEYGISLYNLEDLKNMDAIVLAVAHKEFAKISLEEYYAMMNDDGDKVFADIKGLYSPEDVKKNNMIYWSL